MSMMCSLFSCNNTVADIYGKLGDYVLYRCKRCKKETIFCAKESKVLDNDDKGRKALELMMSDPEFSRQCTIHSEFAKCEFDHPFNISKQEKVKDQIRQKYCLEPGFRQPDPLILLEKGLWRVGKDGESKPKRESKAKKTSKPKSGPKKDSGEKPEGESPKVSGNGENRNYDNLVNVEIRISNRNDKDKSDWDENRKKFVNIVEFGKYGEVVKDQLSVEEQISRIEKRMNKHVEREEYEKAAKLRDQILKLKAGK